MWRASVSTVSSSARLLEIQASSGASASDSQTGMARAMYWACPPSRCGGTTIRRAVEAATRDPNCWRIRCSAASRPAAEPAPVTMVPSWT